MINPLNAKLNPICHLLALLGAHHILHVSRIRVKAIKSVQAFKNTQKNTDIIRMRENGLLELCEYDNKKKQLTESLNGQRKMD